MCYWRKRGPPSNPRVQPTDRKGAGLRLGGTLPERPVDVRLCGRELEGLQLMRIAERREDLLVWDRSR